MSERVQVVAPIYRRQMPDGSKRLVDAVVLEPDRVDTYGTSATAEEIEATAHRFLVKLAGMQAGVGLQHEVIAADTYVVESWIARQDIQYPDAVIPIGSWIVTLWVPSDAVWDAILDGSIAGISFGGTGTIRCDRCGASLETADNGIVLDHACPG